MLMLSPSLGTNVSRALIRHAGLGESQQRRIRIASRLLSVYGVKASVEPWDGTRCTLLVIASGDVLGERAAELALRRRTPVLVIGGNDDPPEGMFRISEGAPSAMILETMRAVLGIAASTPGQPAATQVPGAAVDGSALVRLADHAGNTGGDLYAKVGSTAIKFRWSTGRVIARKHSDLLHARDRLGAAQWSIRPLDAARLDSSAGDVSASIDVFFIRGTLSAHVQALPAFPDGQYQLANWPDLGSAPDLVQSLALANHLVRQPLTVAEAALASGMSAELVERHFWGFRAAGLLVASGSAGAGAAVEPKKSPKPGVWRKLARRFGLVRDDA